MYKDLKRCRICGSEELSHYLDLGSVPLVNALGNHASDKHPTYPLKLLLCKECSLSQLSIVVDPKILYTNYLYHSSISSTFKQHCRDMAVSIKGLFEGLVKPLVIDIASNDGCLLEAFIEEGYYGIGVEPCKALADEATKKGLSIVNEFFDEGAAARLPATDVITATNVLAHVDDVEKFVELAASKLRDITRGVFVVEVPYLVNMVKATQFDMVYHEHLSYFLLRPLIKLFNKCGLSIFRVEEHPIHGGSIRVFASRTGLRAEEKSVQDFVEYEEVNGFYGEAIYERFAKKVGTYRAEFLKTLKSLDGKIAAYGASAKGAILLNACNVDSTLIQYVVDDTVEKQGKFMPGCNIPIVSRDYFDTNHPDYITLLPWNFSDELMEKTKHVGAKYIIPIPEVRIV